MQENSALYTLLLNAAEGRIQCLLAQQEAPKQQGKNPAVLSQVSFQEWHAPSQGAELLTPMLENTLQLLAVAPRQITHIAVVRGPGSFTGVRLVLATAAGLSRAVGAALAGLDYLPLLAFSAAKPIMEAACLRPEGIAFFESLRFWVVTHARRNLVHAQCFSFSANSSSQVANCEVSEEHKGTSICLSSHGMEALTPIEVFDLPQLVDAVSACGNQPFLLGSGAIRNHAALSEMFYQKNCAVAWGTESMQHPTAEVLLRAAEHARYLHEDIEPLYVRQSDAEENITHIAGLLHLDPTEVQQSLERMQKRTRLEK